MDKETARYIFNYFSNFFTDKESIAFRHYSSTTKLADSKNPDLINMYRQKGWLTSDQEALELIKDGYDAFELKTAKRIMEDNGDKIFLNNCPLCGKLARTPDAKQCRHCGHDWHNK
jgi:hypothetical protein